MGRSYLRGGPAETARGAPSYNRMGMGAPPITITCECGERKNVAYGDRWTCDRCGRSWNTQQIPAEEYDGLLRRLRRHKIEALAASAVVAALLIALMVAGGGRYFLLIPMVMSVWLFVFLPFWRRRYRRTAYDTPRWQLEPE